MRATPSSPAAPAARAADGGASAPRRRLTLVEREAQILAGAIAFFSVHGLDGQMRILANEIGVTHALLYHYFPTKQALIDRVYYELFEGRWKPEWETLLDDPARDVADKLTAFYCDYSATVLTRDFVRIFMFSGLSDHYITDRFFSLLRSRLFPRLVRETRRHCGIVSRRKPTVREFELLMGLHGGIFYTGVRQYIYGQAGHATSQAHCDENQIRDRVHSYLLSAAAVLEQALPSTARPAVARLKAAPASVVARRAGAAGMTRAASGAAKLSKTAARSASNTASKPSAKTPARTTTGTAARPIKKTAANTARKPNKVSKGR